MPYSRIYDNYRYTSDIIGDTFFANLYYLKWYSFEKYTKYSIEPILFMRQYVPRTSLYAIEQQHFVLFL